MRSEVQEHVIALRGGILIRQVEIGLRIVFIHVVVPVHRIQTAYDSAVDDGQLPVLTVVDLSTARDDECQPQRPLGIGLKFRHVLHGFHLLLHGMSDNRRLHLLHHHLRDDGVFCQRVLDSHEHAVYRIQLLNLLGTAHEGACQQEDTDDYQLSIHSLLCRRRS